MAIVIKDGAIKPPGVDCDASRAPGRPNVARCRFAIVPATQTLERRIKAPPVMATIPNTNGTHWITKFLPLTMLSKPNDFLSSR